MDFILGVIIATCIIVGIIQLCSRLIDLTFRIIDLIKNGEGERKGTYFNSKTGKLE